MYLSLSTTYQPATDLGFLLQKHPDRLQSRDLSFGTAWVSFPQASADFCEMLLTVDIPFTREAKDGEVYVSDRRYATGSYLPAAIQQVFSSALNRHAKERPDLIEQPLPLRLQFGPLAQRSKTTALDLFEPLGWTGSSTLGISAADGGLDPVAGWGSYHHLELEHPAIALPTALRQLCMVLTVLDPQRHTYLGDEAITRLAFYGEGWLDAHPQRAWMIRRFLRFPELIRKFRAQDMPGANLETPVLETPVLETPIIEVADEVDSDDTPVVPLHEQRIAFAVEQVKGARTVVDMGCGEGKLVVDLLRHTSAAIIAVDPSTTALARLTDRLKLEHKGQDERNRITILQGAAMYPDDRLTRADAVVLLEVVEHIDPRRLTLVEDAIFKVLQPDLVVITTPNRDWNATLPDPDRLRHRDHRFEWTRQEAQAWAARICVTYAAAGYRVALHAIGTVDPAHGAPTIGMVFQATVAG